MRIKRLFKYLVLMLTLLTLSGVVPVFADGAGGSGIGGGGGGTGGGHVENGPSYRKTGFIFYIVDGNGNIIAEPKSAVAKDVYPDSSHANALKTRFGDRIVSGITDGTIQDCPAWNGMQPFNRDSSGNGTAIKNHLISVSDNGKYWCTRFIEYYWGSEVAQEFIDNDDYYLIVEPFLWTSLYKGSEYLGNVCGTTLGWVAMREVYECPEWSSNSTYTIGNLPNSMAFNIDVLGVQAPTDLVGNQTYDNLKTLGYGVIAIWSKMDEPVIEDDPNAPDPVNVTDYLGANQLNYYFPDFQSDMREANSNALIKNMGAESVWKKHTSSPYSNSTLKDSKWYVSEEATSSLVDYYCDEDDSRNKVLFYRASSGLWGSVDDLVKDFTTSQTDVRPGYGFTYSRSVFGDGIVVCDYRGIGTSEKSFITDKLKLSVGHTLSSGLSYTANTESLSDVVKSSTYTFSAYSTENYIETVSYNTGKKDDKGTEDTSDDVDIWDSYTVSHSKKYITSDTDYLDAKISYTLDHGIYKYTPMNLGTSSSYSSGDTVYKGGRVNNAITRAIFSSEVGTLSVIPEIKYKMYKMAHDGEWGTDDAPEPETVYCMGEKERSATGSTIHGYKAYIPSGWLQGTILVDTPLTGTRALEFIENFDDAQDVIQMAPQGTGYTVASTNNPQIACVSMSLDLYDGDISEVSSVVFKPSESWTNPDTATAHTEFVNAIKSNITTEVTSAYFSDKGTNSRVSDFDSMSFDITDTTVSSTTTKQIRILVEGGQIVSGKDDLIDEIETSYGVDEDTAKSILSEWGLETQIRDMLEHSGSVNNKSGASGSATSKWYDEETSALCISVHKTNIQIGNIVLSDKFDYGSSASQDAYNIGLNGSNGRQIRFFFSLGFINHEISFGGNTYNVSDKLYLIDNTEIKGARALISNQTSHDWLY